MTPEQMRDASLLELFSLEAEAQTQVLSAGLMALERIPGQADQLEACMRAAHSLKGAARIVGIDAGVSVAHVMEDCLVAAQEGRLLFRLHAFGDDDTAKGGSETDDAFDDGQVFRIPEHVAHKTLVDLEHACGKSPQIRQ